MTFYIDKVVYVNPFANSKHSARILIFRLNWVNSSTSFIYPIKHLLSYADWDDVNLTAKFPVATNVIVEIFKQFLLDPNAYAQYKLVSEEESLQNVGYTLSMMRKKRWCVY